MRTVNIFFVALIACAIGLVGCKKKSATDTETKSEPAAKVEPAKAEPAAAPAGDTGSLSKEDFIKASITLGCLSQKEKDPAKLAEKSLEIYKKYGMDAATWSSAAQKFASEQSVAMEVAKGLQSCP